jgi:hypothetical protein
MNEFVSAKSVCLVNSHAECNREWISQADGLLPAYFQTEEPEIRQENVYSIACQHCTRNNFGVGTPRTPIPNHFL